MRNRVSCSGCHVLFIFEHVKTKKEMVAITSILVVMMKFLFGMCDCILNSSVGTCDGLLVLEISHICGHKHV